MDKLKELLLKKEKYYNDESIDNDDYYSLIEEIDNKIINEYTVAEIAQAELELGLTEPDPDPEDGDNTKRCVLCGCELEGYGNNPYPLATEGRCCDSCDMQVVAARMRIFMESRKGGE